MAWNLSSPNWQELICTEQSLVPRLPLDEKAAGRAVNIFDKLRVPDVPGKPLLKDAAGDWFRDIVRVLDYAKHLRTIIECLNRDRDSGGTNDPPERTLRI